MTIREKADKTQGSKTLDALLAPFETLEASGVVTVCRALLKAKHPKSAYQVAADRLTRLEDWLELEHPRLPRAGISAVRRQLEARGW